MANRDDEAFEEPERPRVPKRPPEEGEGIRDRPRRPRAEREDEDRDDEEDDRPRRRSRRGRQEDDTLAGLIPYRNGMALAAYYCGVFSLIPCIGGILGPLSIIFGILGLRKVSDNPSARGTGHAIAGIVLGSLVTLGHLIVVIIILVNMPKH
jgi:hypothetical protein